MSADDSVSYGGEGSFSIRLLKKEHEGLIITNDLHVFSCLEDGVETSRNETCQSRKKT